MMLKMLMSVHRPNCVTHTNTSTPGQHTTISCNLELSSTVIGEWCGVCNHVQFMIYELYTYILYNFAACPALVQVTALLYYRIMNYLSSVG